MKNEEIRIIIVKVAIKQARSIVKVVLYIILLRKGIDLMLRNNKKTMRNIRTIKDLIAHFRLLHMKHIINSKFLILINSNNIGYFKRRDQLIRHILEN